MLAGASRSCSPKQLGNTAGNWQPMNSVWPLERYFIDVHLQTQRVEEEVDRSGQEEERDFLPHLP